MAELDYAYLADYATVQDGKISAIGASFTHVRPPELPFLFSSAVAGRIRTSVSEGPVALAVEVRPPNEEFEFEVSGMISPGPDVRTYADGNIGLLFTLAMQLTLPASGLYVVNVKLEGEVARRLAFDVEAIAS